MIMPEHSYTSESYRDGFKGKEKDDEVFGNGNQCDYGFRSEEGIKGATQYLEENYSDVKNEIIERMSKRNESKE